MILTLCASYLFSINFQEDYFKLYFSIVLKCCSHSDLIRTKNDLFFNMFQFKRWKMDFIAWICIFNDQYCRIFYYSYPFLFTLPGMLIHLYFLFFSLGLHFFFLSHLYWMHKNKHAHATTRCYRKKFIKTMLLPPNPTL